MPEPSDARPDGERSGEPGPPGPERDAAATPPPDRPPEPAPPERAVPLTQQVGRVVLVVAALLFVVFALFNAQHVDFNWVFGETETVTVGGEHVEGGVRLIYLLVAAFVLGAIVAGLGTRHRGRRRTRARAAKDDEPPSSKKG